MKPVVIADYIPWTIDQTHWDDACSRLKFKAKHAFVAHYRHFSKLVSWFDLGAADRVEECLSFSSLLLLPLLVHRACAPPLHPPGMQGERAFRANDQFPREYVRLPAAFDDIGEDVEIGASELKPHVHEEGEEEEPEEARYRE